MAALERAGWEVRVETVEIALEPLGRAQDVAEMQMIIGSAPMLLRGLDPTEADRAAVAEAMAEAFAAYEHDGVVRVPAVIHFITGAARG